MRESKWYGLRIPEQDDEYNVDDFGAAFDKTDDALHRLSAALETESELVRIDHGLGSYPQVTLGALQYGLGVAGLDEGPLGGTNTAQYPARAVYHSSRSLTVITTKSIAQLGTEPTLHKMNDREYTVTWPDNQTDSLYIRLI